MSWRRESHYMPQLQDSTSSDLKMKWDDTILIDALLLYNTPTFSLRRY